MKPEVVFLAAWAIALLATWPPWFWWTIKSRRARGEPLIPRRPSNALFYEDRASGRARGVIGGAHRALVVCVTNQDVWITPAFPFTLFIPYGFFRLDTRTPRGRVTAELFEALMGRRVLVTLQGPDGPRDIELRLSDPDRFLAALRGAH